MKIDGIRPDSLGTQAQLVGTVVAVQAIEGKLPDLFRGQHFTATVVEANKQHVRLNLHDALITLPLSADVQPGTELSLRVANVTPQLLVEVTSPPSRLAIPLPPLTLGQAIEVELLEELPNGRVLVNLQGTSLEAEVASDIPIGARVQASVTQLQPQIVLQLVANAKQSWQSEALHLLRSTVAHRVPESESLQTLLPALATLIEAAPHNEVPTSVTKLHTFLKTLLQDTTPPDAERLATFIRDGGLQYEAKLTQQATLHSPDFTRVAESDVKGLLLQTLKDLQQSPGGKFPLSLASSQLHAEEQLPPSATHEATRRSVVSALTTHLEHIENQQAVNILAQSHSEPYQLQIPFFTDQGMTTAFVAISADGSRHENTTEEQGQKSPTSYSILFFLDLEGLGQTRIEARIGSQSLWGAFYVDQPESVALLQAELPAFRTTLQLLGYDEVLLIAKPLGQLSPEKRQKFDALASGTPGSIHLLDMRA